MWFSQVEKKGPEKSLKNKTKQMWFSKVETKGPEKSLQNKTKQNKQKQKQKKDNIGHSPWPYTFLTYINIPLSIATPQKQKGHFLRNSF